MKTTGIIAATVGTLLTLTALAAGLIPFFFSIAALACFFVGAISLTY